MNLDRFPKACDVPSVKPTEREERCPECLGEGYICESDDGDDEKCPECKGNGTVTVQIPEREHDDL